MREIKFRGKTKIGKWVYGLLGSDYSKPNDKYYHIDNCDSEVSEYPVDENTVGQFTGLHDQNGKEIYEGDILELTDKWSNSVWYATIVFGNPYAQYSWGWNLLYIKGDKGNTDILCWVEMEETGAYCEVIGNIYDNPELLEVEE